MDNELREKIAGEIMNGLHQGMTYGEISNQILALLPSQPVDREKLIEERVDYLHSLERLGRIICKDFISNLAPDDIDWFLSRLSVLEDKK